MYYNIINTQHTDLTDLPETNTQLYHTEEKRTYTILEYAYRNPLDTDRFSLIYTPNKEQATFVRILVTYTDVPFHNALTLTFTIAELEYRLTHNILVKYQPPETQFYQEYRFTPILTTN